MPLGRFVIVTGVGLMACADSILAHDIITTPITWDREISRIVYRHCAGCHRPGGNSFPLMDWHEARPWAEAIKEETLSRRMPPWGAVKGFGSFRDDGGLSMEELELIVNWADGDAPEGDARDVPPLPKFPGRPATSQNRHGELVISGDVTLAHPLSVNALLPVVVIKGATFRITAELPDGSVMPLLWVYEWNPQFGHEFRLRKPIQLPAGSVIRGVPQSARIALLTVTSDRSPARQNGPYSPFPASETGPRHDNSAAAENRR
jgi:hypothetical protein